MNTIKAVAHPNELIKDIRNDYYLIHQPIGTLYRKDIIRRLDAKNIPTRNVDGDAFVQIFMEECLLAVSEGYNVVTDLCHITIGIRGSVQAQMLGHTIPAEQLKVRMNFVQGHECRKAIANVAVSVAEQPAPKGPMIQKVCVPPNGNADVLRTGDMALLQGLRLAIRGNRTDELGVYFTPAEGGESIRITADRISPNVPSKLQFVLPAEVTPGEWRVEVATQSSTSTTVQTEYVRRYEYKEIITVV